MDINRLAQFEQSQTSLMAKVGLPVSNLSWNSSSTFGEDLQRLKALPRILNNHYVKLAIIVALVVLSLMVCPGPCKHVLWYSVLDKLGP